MAGGDERSWFIRPATSADSAMISEILVAAGRVAWGPFLGEARVEEANRGQVHPADLGSGRSRRSGPPAWSRRGS